jgi:phage gpG-like protein
MQSVFDDFIKNCLNDVEVKWKELIQENFRRQSWHGEGWPPKRPYPGSRAKTLYKEGLLQESVDPLANHANQTIEVTSPLPYAALHNDGGEITVTAKMKRFFWAMHLKAKGAKARGARAVKLNAEAEHWKGLALMKVGSKMKIPRRRFVGDHPVLDAAIERIVDLNVKEAADALAAHLQAGLDKAGGGQTTPGGTATPKGAGNRGSELGGPSPWEQRIY